VPSRRSTAAGQNPFHETQAARCTGPRTRSHRRIARTRCTRPVRRAVPRRASRRSRHRGSTARRGDRGSSLRGWPSRRTAAFRRAPPPARETVRLPDTGSRAASVRHHATRDTTAQPARLLIVVITLRRDDRWHWRFVKLVNLIRRRVITTERDDYNRKAPTSPTCYAGCGSGIRLRRLCRPKCRRAFAPATVDTASELARSPRLPSR